MTSLICIETPFGPVSVAAQGDRLTCISFRHRNDRNITGLLREAARQLAAYFDGTLRAFDLPLAPAASPFQDRLRHAMCAIPFGETRSYADLARTLGSAPRAVGQGCGRNPLPIVVPCHRVVAASGKLGGFSAGEGPATKQRLLAHESAQQPLEL